MAHVQEQPRTLPIEIMAKFTAHTVCQQGEHLKTSRFHCAKHQAMLYNCKLCELSSNWNKYAYQCNQCKQCFCVQHYIDHATLFAANFCNSEGKRFDCRMVDIDISNCNVKWTLYKRIAMNIRESYISVKITDQNANKVKILSLFVKAKNIKQLSNSLIRYKL